MPNFTISFGLNGNENAWYFRNGPTGFKAIDIAALPGPKPSFTSVKQQLVVSYTADAFSGELLYKDRVQAATGADGTTNVDQLPDWNTVKNLQLLSDSAQKFFLDGFVHVDAEIGRTDTAATTLILNGSKRANIITGLGDDLIDIRMVSDQNSVWVDAFRVNTGAGKDTVLLSGLDINAELAAGDMTFIQAENKPGLALVNTGEGRSTYLATGANDDRIVSYTSNDHIIAGTDDGTIGKVMVNGPASGFGYAVGGSIGKGCDSILYKVDLKTGKATAVGEVQIPLGCFGNIGGLDVESLALNPADGQLYGFASKFGILDALVRIDPLTAKTTYIKLNCTGFRAELQDMAFGTDGSLYFASSGDLMKVDPKTGGIKMVGNNTLDCKIGALAVDPLTGKLYGLSELGSTKGTVLYEIDKASGKTLSASKIVGTDRCSAIEGMSFDSDGTLWAVDHVSGSMFKINIATKTATLASKTLTDGQQYGDGFEALAISAVGTKMLGDLKALGGDVITTGTGTDHLYYTTGDGVDTIKDFDKTADILHITGYTADQMRIDVLNGNTFIRFADTSDDGYVDNAMIELMGVTQFDASLISYTAQPWL